MGKNKIMFSIQSDDVILHELEKLLITAILQSSCFENFKIFVILKVTVFLFLFLEF